MEQLGWIKCAEPGCAAGVIIDIRLARHFEGRDWRCADHEGPN